MSMLALILSQQLDRPVDNTGLGGRYDFSLQ